MIKKNDILDVDIIDMGYNMEGIAKHDGVVLFVPFAIVGEKVRVKVINTKQKAYICKIVELLKPSPNRISPVCPYFSKCGGCQCQHISYDYALQLKKDLVQNAITHIAKQNIIVSDTVASDKIYGYRNKLALPVDPVTKKVGMFKEYSHTVLPIMDCSIQEKWAKDYIDAINIFIAQNNISVYDETTGKGVLRHVVGRCYDEKYLFTIVINADKLDKVENLINILKEKFDDFGLNININRQKSNLIMTDKFVHIFGRENIDICENDISYSINNASFFQVNNYIKNQIYSRVFDNISNDIVIDAYSGAGLLTAMCAKKCKFAYGIEIVNEATVSADKLMKKNNIKNMQNICGDSALVLPKLLNSIKGDITLILDPPRKGCDERVIDAIVGTRPKKIIYISCNPSTLARDIYNLTTKCESFRLVSVTPFDMFPQTKHVETLAILECSEEGKCKTMN